MTAKQLLKQRRAVAELACLSAVTLLKAIHATAEVYVAGGVPTLGAKELKELAGAVATLCDRPLSLSGESAVPQRELSLSEDELLAALFPH